MTVRWTSVRAAVGAEGRDRDRIAPELEGDPLGEVPLRVEREDAGPPADVDVRRGGVGRPGDLDAVRGGRLVVDRAGQLDARTRRPFTGVPLGDDARLLDGPAGVDRHREPHELRHRPRERGRGAGALAVAEAVRVGLVPDLLGDQVPGVAGPRHGLQVALRRVSGGEGVLPPLAGEQRPEPPDAGPVVRRPVGLLAVAVVVVAVGEEPVVGLAADRRVDLGQRARDVGVVGRQHTEPDEVEEPGVDHGALVEGAAAVVEVERVAVVRVAVVVDALEVVAVAERPRRRDGPPLHPAAPVVGGREVERPGADGALAAGQVRGRHQPGDLRGDRAGE